MAAVGGLDPSVLVAPDYQTQLLQAQRRLAMAQALQSQAMADTPGNGGSVSWTQGLARLAQALSANANSRAAFKQMQGANQGYAAGMARLFGLNTPPSAQPNPGGPMSLGGPQMAQGAPPAASGTPTPQMAPQAPQGGSVSPLGFDPNAIAATAQGQAVAPVAPPQAAPQPPSAAPSPTGGASYPMSLTGNPGKDLMLYMENPEEFSKAQIANAAPVDIAKTVQQAQAAIARGDMGTASALLANVNKQNYIAPISGRPGGWTVFPDGHREFNPQAPAPGAMPVIGPDGKPTGAWTEDPSAAGIQAHQAGAIAGAQAAGRAPYDVQEVYNPATGQMELRPKSDITGGGPLNSHYGVGQGSGPSAPSGGGHFAAAPPLGQQAAANTYGSGSANAFLETQGIANNSPQRVQSLREMESLISGPNALTTGPTRAKLQEIATEHGLPFGFSDQGFVFNKDAARFVAQSAQDLGLNGSDARLGMMANASPNMKMTPQALHVVIPTMIGLEYAKMAKASAAANWAQRSPGTNAQFESQWRQSYDPRMFTAYAQGGPAALARAPANLRQQWLKDYRQLKTMGVDFGAFAQ